jgi:mono/diheme cytochrome c family protein
MRYLFLFHLLFVATVLSIGGLRGGFSASTPIEIFPDMDRQPKLKAQKPSAFFADGMGARQPVAGTVPLGFELADRGGAGPARDEFTTLSPDYYYTGRYGDYWGSGMPDELGLDPESAAAFLRRGRERYDIYCAVCHGESGNGQGVVKQAGFAGVVSLLDPKFLTAQYADGTVFNTVTMGKGLMGGYGDKLTVRDRWAIVAWLRVLQDLDAGLPAGDPQIKELLERAAPAATPPAAD